MVFKKRSLDLFFNVAWKWSEEPGHCKFIIIHTIIILYIIKEERTTVF